MKRKEFDRLPPLLTEKDVAEIMQVSVGWLQNDRSESKRNGREAVVPYLKEGGLVRYRKCVLEEKCYGERSSHG
jgi:hypothetical protein